MGGLIATNLVPSDCTVPVSFSPVPIPKVKFLDMVWADTNFNHALHSNGLALLGDLRKRVLSCYPVATVDAQYGTIEMPYSTNDPPTFDQVLAQLQQKRNQDSYYDSISFSPVGNRIYHGVIPPATEGTYGGATPSLGAFYSTGYMVDTYGTGWQTVSHELGHNLGIDHDVNSGIFGITNELDANKNIIDMEAKGACMETGGLYTDYPLFEPVAGFTDESPALGPMTLGDNALIYGLDTQTVTNDAAEPVLSPVNSASVTAYFDLMSYCPAPPRPPEDRWPSTVTYSNLITGIKSLFGTSTPALASVRSRLPQPQPQGSTITNYLVVSGAVDFYALTVQLFPCVTLNSTNPVPLPQPGTNFVLEGLDGSGTWCRRFRLGWSRTLSRKGTQISPGFLSSTCPRIRPLKRFRCGTRARCWAT